MKITGKKVTDMKNRQQLSKILAQINKTFSQISKYQFAAVIVKNLSDFCNDLVNLERIIKELGLRDILCQIFKSDEGIEWIKDLKSAVEPNHIDNLIKFITLII